MNYAVVNYEVGTPGRQIDRCHSLLVAIDKAMAHGRAAVTTENQSGEITILYATTQKDNREQAIARARSILHRLGLEEFRS